MKLKLLDILVCPQCGGALTCSASVRDDEGEIQTGSLRCVTADHNFPIENGIPRFVPRANYAESFGYQWNKFKQEQLDSANGTTLSAQRFYAETTWTRDWMDGKWILDAGCGAGRFLDVASKTDAEIVGVDISSAVDAARENLKARPNVHLVQASIYQLPFRRGAFDGCYSIGVIQHTPDPRAALRALPGILRTGGRIAVTIYERKLATWLNMKYLVRPITKRMPKQKLLRMIKRTMPVLFPVTSIMFRLPLLGRVFRFAIPVANYTNVEALSTQQRYDWALLDTFDMLSPEYDQPQTYEDVDAALSSAGIVELRRLSPTGLNVGGVKGA